MSSGRLRAAAGRRGASNGRRPGKRAQVLKRQGGGGDSAGAAERGGGAQLGNQRCLHDTCGSEPALMPACRERAQNAWAHGPALADGAAILIYVHQAAPVGRCARHGENGRLFRQALCPIGLCGKGQTAEHCWSDCGRRGLSAWTADLTSHGQPAQSSPSAPCALRSRFQGGTACQAGSLSPRVPNSATQPVNQSILSAPAPAVRSIATAAGPGALRGAGGPSSVSARAAAAALGALPHLVPRHPTAARHGAH